MSMKSRKFLAIIYFIYTISQTHETRVINHTFVATKEWQTIEEGQHIPAGLYVRVNLHTGKKEAKLLDETDDDDIVVESISNKNVKSLSELPTPDSTSNVYKALNINNNKPKISKSLKKIIRKTMSLDYSIDYFEDMKTRIKKSYKDYEELKRELQDMKMSFKTDSELITGLLKEFNKTQVQESLYGIKEFLAILEDMNYLVHQIDNALWFIDSGGLDYVVLPMIVNQTNLEYRISALRLLGALTQNNPKAQIEVYEKNFGTYIGNILLKSQNVKEISSALYAFGSLLRKFPHAQKEILPKSGMKSLIEVLRKDTELKNKVKVLLLIADLIRDQENILNNEEMMVTIDDNQLEMSKVAQYYDINFNVWLKENQFCEVVIDVIWQHQNEMLSQPNFADDIIDGLTVIKSVCQKLWSNSSVLKIVLTSLENDFQISDQEYVIEVSQKLSNLKLLLFSDIEKYAAKEEL